MLVFPFSAMTEFVFANCVTQNAFCAEVIYTSHVSLTIGKGINFDRDLNIHSILLHQSALLHACLPYHEHLAVFSYFDMPWFF